MEPHVDSEVREVAEAIDTMAVRGAAAIADAAAEAFRAEMRAAARTLHDTRPTAVSLPNTLRYVLREMSGETVAELRRSAVAGAEEFRRRLDRAQTDLGRVGANRLRDGDVVMTHCHSTAVVACIEASVGQGKGLSAVVNETRPRN